MKSLSERLRHALKQCGKTQVALASACGVTKGAVNQWISGSVKTVEGANLLNAARFLGVSPQWLQTGEGPMEQNYLQGTTNTSYDINVEPAQNIAGTVPLISWVQAGVFCLSPDLFQPGDAEDWLPCVQKLGPHAYALRVRGDSMTSSYGRSYPEGCLIFVDPDAPITNGCRVIAKLPGTDETTFKVYVEDAGRRYLRPLNPQYPVIELTADMALCGVVRGYYMPE